MTLQDNHEMTKDQQLYLLQIEHEKDMTETGKVRFNQRRLKNVKRETEADTLYGNTITAHYTVPLAEAIDAFVLEASSGKAGRKHRALSAIAGLDTRVVALLTLKAIVNTLSSRKPLQHVMCNIGSMIEDEVRFRELREADKGAYKYMLEQAAKRTSYHHKQYFMVRASARKGFEWDGWSSGDKLHIGQKLLDLLMGVSDIVEIVTQSMGKNKTLKFLKATPVTLEWMDKRNQAGAYMSPKYEPMIVPPRDWETPFDGGYLTSFVKPLTLVKTHNRNYLDELAEVEMPIVKSAINTMQKTAWQINTGVLEVMETLIERGGGIVGLPLQFDMPVPMKPLDIATNDEARKMWKMEAAYVYKDNIELSSSRISFAITMDCVNKYADFEKIYFPYQMDFRGRVYAATNLTPQGPDWQKGLLRFATGTPLGEEGGTWLAVQGSNLVGVDKVSFEDRVQFILDNEPEILLIAADPYENKGWMAGFAGRVDSKGDPKEVDSPWQFLAFCQEWAQYCVEGDEYLSKVPCSLDGTCSGLQHYGMALADEVGGEFVNLTPGDKPHDIYAEVARKVIIQLEIDAVSGAEDSTKEEEDEVTGVVKERLVQGSKLMARQWLKFGVDRSTTKRATMTTAYGSRAYGFKNQLISDLMRPALRKATNKDHWVDRESFPFETDGFAAAGYMAGLIWQSVSATVVKAAEAMDWLKSMASLVGSEGLPIRWTTPVGFPVFQAYRDMSPRRVETQIAGKRIVLTVSTPTDAIDRRAQSGAVAPNWIHSLDASHLQLTVVRAAAAGVESFALVHDSFGTTAGQLPLLYTAVRETMYEQYSSANVMEVLRDEIIPQLTPKNAEKLPELPKRGTLDLALILDSKYCFA